MIDGAHVLSPGVLRFGVLGLRTYAPAVVSTHQWFIGPGQQSDAMDAGYDQAYEDRLFDEVEWPVDGYRLFEIGHPVAGFDWFDGLWESNCVFVPRSLLERMGAFDESFSMPGGGYTNLDLFERLGATPGVTVVDIIGEASFHQIHGGTTTNQPDVDTRHSRLISYREHYEQIRGRPFRGPGKRRHFVGTMFDAARRTRPRWSMGTAFRQAQRIGVDGFPEQPTPVPDDLREAYTDAYWRSLGWRDSTWLGRRIERSPADLVAYQELIATVRPEWIIETRWFGGERTSFLASICDSLGHGRVLSVRAQSRGKREQHPRIEYVTGAPAAERTLNEVREIVGDAPSAMVILSPARRTVLLDEFSAYAPMVGVGSYVIVENTILNGNPVLPEFGPGPNEAVKMILNSRGDFTRDLRAEGAGPTFNPGGFLKRVR